MSRSFRFGVTAVLLALVWNASGCKKGDQPGKQGSKTDVVIGVSLLTRTHPFYQELEAGLSEAAAEFGYKLIITSGEFDVARQKDQLQDFIVRKVNAIVVSPCDSRSIGTSIRAANDAGIPVFTADIACLAEGVPARARRERRTISTTPGSSGIPRTGSPACGWVSIGPEAWAQERQEGGWRRKPSFARWAATAKSPLLIIRRWNRSSSAWRVLRTSWRRRPMS